MTEGERTERGKDRHRRQSIEAIGKSKGKRNVQEKRWVTLEGRKSEIRRKD